MAKHKVARKAVAESASVRDEGRFAAPAICRLQFLPIAMREWEKLDGSVQLQFSKALEKRLVNPRIPQAALASMPDCYKIKLRSIGYRLVYRVDDDALILLAIAVGRRDKNAVYDAASGRLNSLIQAAMKSSVNPTKRR